jgi:hypothetical protein
MRLAAIRAGLGVAGPSFDGTVHSVFARAVNLAVGDRLTALVAAELGNFPRAYLVDAAPDFDFARHLAPGDPVACRGGILRVAGRELSVDLAHAAPWRAGLGQLAIDKSDRAIARTLETVARRLAAHDHGVAFSRLAADRIAALAHATSRLDVDGASEGATRLIGFGPGLTPSGDDYLVGFLAGLWSVASADAAFHAFRLSFARRIVEAARGTNEISQVFLEAAAEGEVSERLATLAAAIARAEPDAQLAAACDAALDVGASSGADGVAGLIAALDLFAVRVTERRAAIF